MKEMTYKALTVVAAYGFILVSVAMLAGCDVTKYVVKCATDQKAYCD